MRPTDRARSEKRSITESQKPPNLLTAPISTATLPSMKSKMLATTMMPPAVRKWPRPSAHPAAMLMRTPVNVRKFGWIRSRTHTAMMSRSG